LPIFLATSLMGWIIGSKYLLGWQCLIIKKFFFHGGNLPVHYTKS
jgi:hypothetical protein